ncbi:MAG TPA: YfcE family phosphodiesterase [Acidimicrobiales bacterium]|nr:YfcE family phosphodiesterase [Acidimicrobiales bacterium]
MAVTALVLADTHLRTGGPRWLPDAVVSHLPQVDVVLHAGDVLDAGVLDRLRSEAGVPVHAVLGNNDDELAGRLPLTVTIELAGVRVGMVHDSGRTKGREQRLRSLFPACDLVVFGHSHVPVDSVGLDGQRIFNPGSPTQRRQQPVATFGLLRLDRGVVREHRILPV